MRSHPVLNYVPRVASVTFRLRPPVPARLYITDAWKTLLHGEDTKKKREREGGRKREAPLSVRLMLPLSSLRWSGSSFAIANPGS